MSSAAATDGPALDARLIGMAARAAGLGHWRLDLASGKIFWSDEVYRIHGVDASRFTPTLEVAKAVYEGEDRERLEALMARAAGEGEGFSFQMRIRRMSDGAPRIVRADASVERDAAGRPAVLFGLFLDVTDDIETLERLAENEARHRLLLDSASDIICRWDLDGVFSFVSPAFESNLGWSPEEMVGRTTWSVIHPDDHAPLRRAWRDYLAAGRLETPLRAEYRGLHRDGRVIWLECHSRVLRGVDGGVEIMDVVRNVQVRRELEEQLRGAAEAAEAAARAKAEFLANMSHELRTPLQAILGYAALLRDYGELTPRDQHFVGRIGAAGEALMAVIGDVLDFSRLEGGEVELEETRFCLRDVAEEAVSMIAPAARAKGLRTAVEVDLLTPDDFKADRGRLRQVLLNLLANAVKFTEAGFVRLTVEGRGPDVRLAVVDTGPGIAEADQPRLFRRFSQIDGSARRTHGGSGLGLAICKALVERMGGEIGVTSAPGQGAEFWFTLPTDGAPPGAPAAD